MTSPFTTSNLRVSAANRRHPPPFYAPTPVAVDGCARDRTVSDIDVMRRCALGPHRISACPVDALGRRGGHRPHHAS